MTIPNYFFNAPPQSKENKQSTKNLSCSKKQQRVVIVVARTRTCASIIQIRNYIIFHLNWLYGVEKCCGSHVSGGFQKVPTRLHTHSCKVSNCSTVLLYLCIQIGGVCGGGVLWNAHKKKIHLRFQVVITNFRNTNFQFRNLLIAITVYVSSGHLCCFLPSTAPFRYWKTAKFLWHLFVPASFFPYFTRCYKRTHVQ